MVNSKWSAGESVAIENKNEEKNRKTSRVIPWSCLILGLITVAAGDGAVGVFFLLGSFISHVFCATIDFGANPTSHFSYSCDMEGDEGSDRDIDMFCIGMIGPDGMGRSEIFDDNYVFGCGASPVSCGCTFEMEV